MERYVLRGGRAGYARLQVLARARQAETAELVRRAGLRPACGAWIWAAAAVR